MRYDSIGMFWEDLPTVGRSSAPRVMPPIPDTGWTTPTSFPNLSSAVVIAIDTETYDPELLVHGPGWARGVGHLVGVSVAVIDSLGNLGKWYFPMRHEIESEMNLCPEKVLSWCRDAFSNPNQPKIGANILYDIGWLQQESVYVKGSYIDVQYAEALLDESAKVSLEKLGQKYLGEGKESNELYEWCANFYGGEANGRQRANIYRAPPRLVGPYAESDADLPLRLAEPLYSKLAEQNLTPLFDMECRLIPLLRDMRFAGVTIDVDKAEEVYDTLSIRVVGYQKQLKKLVGFGVNVNSGDSLAKAFRSLDVPFGLTTKGKPSFTKDFLEKVKHPIGDLVREIRRCEKIKGTFIESYILNSHVNGKVYGQFHPLRGDSGGTRSGRFSSSTPNLQNIPSRDDELAPLIRGMFIPDFGHAAWRKYDYSQIEYLFLIHYAVGLAGETAREYFTAHPDTDYHVYTQKIVERRTGRFIERKPIKNINFGLIYGMGNAALAARLGLTRRDAALLIKNYFEGVPFVKPTMDACIEEASTTGEITTILGRRSRFNLWEPLNWSKTSIALPYEKAIQTYGRVRRAYTHKALNRRLQGSAADMMKMAMLKCYEDGIFDETGVPRLTVHDELDFSDPGGKDEAFEEMRHTMETVLPLKIRIRAGGEIGPNWGNVKKLKKGVED